MEKTSEVEFGKPWYWRREDFLPYALMGVGLFLFVSESAILYSNLDMFLMYPGFSFWFWTFMFSMPTIAFVVAVWMLREVGRTYSRLFPLNWPEAAQMVEEILQREGIRYRSVAANGARMFFWRPDAILTIEKPNVAVRIFGSKRAGKYFGPVTRVYVGKFTEENREATRVLLKKLDRVDEIRGIGTTP